MKSVYALRGDALGTRILAVMHARMLASYLDLPFQICWPSLGAPFFDHDDYLDLPNIDRVIADRHFFKAGTGSFGAIVEPTVLSDLKLVHLCSPRDQLTVSRSEFLAAHRDVDGFVIEEAMSMLPDDSSRDGLEVRIQAYWRDVNWTAQFRSLLAMFDADASAPRTQPPSVALHVRRGDMVRMLLRGGIDHLLPLGMEQILQRFAPFEAYVNALANLDLEGARVVICAENPEDVERFRQRCGRDRFVSSWDIDLRPTERAFLDVALLARAATIIGPPVSYYSRCGAALGGAQLAPLAHDPAHAIPELFAMIDRADCIDADDVKALVCAMYGQLTRSGDSRVNVDIWKTPPQKATEPTDTSRRAAPRLGPLMRLLRRRTID